MLESDFYDYTEEGPSTIHWLLAGLETPLDCTITALTRLRDLDTYSFSPVESVYTTLPAHNTLEVFFRGSSNDSNDHLAISHPLIPPPLPCFTLTEVMHITVHATLIKDEASPIVLPLIGVKWELKEEDKENIAPPSKKRRVHKVYKKEICRQWAREINSPERVTCIEL